MADYPTPRPGLVIRYAYLWKREAEAGLIEGVKDRPCVVVLAVTRQKDSTRVVVAPITRSPAVVYTAIKDKILSTKKASPVERSE